MGPHISEKNEDSAEDLLQQHTLDEIIKLLPFFWDLRDDLIQKNGHTITTFKARINRLIELKREEERTW